MEYAKIDMDGIRGDSNLNSVLKHIGKIGQLEQELAKLKEENEKLNTRFNNLTTFLISDLNFGGGFVSRLMDNELSKREKKIRYDLHVK